MELSDLEMDVYTIIENILLTFPEDATQKQILHCVKHASSLHYYLKFGKEIKKTI